MDAPEAQVIYMERAADGAYDATMSDGTVVQYRPPGDLMVLIPGPERQARFERWANDRAEKRAKAERPAKAVGLRRANPRMSFAAIAKEVGASPASVSKWIREADGEPRPKRQRKAAPTLTEAELRQAQDQALAEFVKRGGSCTRREIDARAQEISAEMLRRKR